MDLHLSAGTSSRKRGKGWLLATEPPKGLPQQEGFDFLVQKAVVQHVVPAFCDRYSKAKGLSTGGGLCLKDFPTGGRHMLRPTEKGKELYKYCGLRRRRPPP